MTKLAFCIRKLGCLLGVLSVILLPALYAAPAHAQNVNFHSWVSNTGSDGNTCTEASPCATFAHALYETVAGGEINCLNSGSYIPGAGLMITKSITIDCYGVFAWGNGDTATYIGDAITINGSGIVVHLRNLSISGLSLTTADGSANQNGVTIAAAAVVNIEDCFINNLGASGINVVTSANTILKVRNTSIAEAATGITLAPSAGTVNASIENTSVAEMSSNGITANGTSGGTIKATISNSVVSSNASDGIEALSSGSTVWVLVDQTEVSGNGTGLAASGSVAEILARNTSIFGNTTGLSISGGAIYSYGTNSVNGNATNGAFTSTVAMK
jgi:hypothetical protein